MILKNPHEDIYISEYIKDVTYIIKKNEMREIIIEDNL